MMDTNNLCLVKKKFMNEKFFYERKKIFFSVLEKLFFLRLLRI